MMRSLQDIRDTGAAWVTEIELTWLCDEVGRLRGLALELRRDPAHAECRMKEEQAEARLAKLVEARDLLIELESKIAIESEPGMAAFCDKLTLIRGVLALLPAAAKEKP